MNDKKVVIELQNIKRNFLVGDEVVHALRGISFVIHEGEFVTIMGTSGSGKSTLLNTLGCLDTPTSGEYLLDGVSVRTMSKPQRAVLRNRKIGFVFQNYNLLPKTTAVENVELPLMYNSSVSAAERRKRAVEALIAVGLGDRLEHKSNQMSGGQMQRVAIARALVNNPSVILADEATGNLDTRTSFEILVLFQKLHAEGRTIIFVTHNPDLSQYSSRNIRLRDGHVIEDKVVDDEPLALNLLESYVQKTSFLELTGKYSSAVMAMKELPDKKIDLLFLDIQMPELNGLEFSKMVPANTRIVFTTAFGQYAIDGYKVNALDYLLKPISYVDFLQAANKALQWFELLQQPREEKESIFVKSEYKLVQIMLKDILYIEGLKDYIKIYEENQPKPVLCLMSMKAMEEQLPPKRFIRVHRSYIVQKDKIRIIDRGRIVFGKTYIPISDSYKQAFQDFLDSPSQNK